jgi:hypothetical protein
MSEMVGRAARAAFEYFRSNFWVDYTPAWEEQTTADREPWIAAQRAAIAALREPTGEMKDVGAATYGVHNTHIGPLPNAVIDGQPSKAWRAMIDEALR